MKLSENQIYYSRADALDDIRMFKELHPKSKKGWKVIKEVTYTLERVI